MTALFLSLIILTLLILAAATYGIAHPRPNNYSREIGSAACRKYRGFRANIEGGHGGQTGYLPSGPGYVHPQSMVIVDNRRTFNDAMTPPERVIIIDVEI